jgi:putative hemolysin
MLIVDIAILLVLILLNGFFAMSELAVVSARSARLQSMEDEGIAGAGAARRLAEDPGRFLSSVQIGITLIGILTGAFSGARLAGRIAPSIEQLGLSAEVAHSVTFACTVVLVTYFTLILGELVPKQIALSNPERIATSVARIMRAVAWIAAPAVWLLDVSSTGLVKLLGIQKSTENAVTEEEIRTLIAEAERAGVVEPAETVMMARVMRLGDLSVRAAMTPRPEVDWIDLDQPRAAQLEQLVRSRHSRLPVGHGRIDEVTAVIHTRELVQVLSQGENVDLMQLAEPAAVLPDGSDLLAAMEALRAAPADMAFVVDEYGTFEGIVTSADLLHAIAGRLESPEPGEEPEIVQRGDGSWLLDGTVAVEAVADLLGFKPPDAQNYHTLAGLALERLRRVPKAGDSFTFEGWDFEVVDMDARRIDKLLAKPTAAGASEDEPQ